jgi:hypothetical protein
LAGLLFRLHGLDTTVPHVRSALMPDTEEAVRDGGIVDPRADTGLHYRLMVEDGQRKAELALTRAQEKCRDSNAPPDGSRLDYCIISAGAGDPDAQAAVAEFYMSGTTRAAKAEAYAWLSAASENKGDRTTAAIARVKRNRLEESLDGAALDRAEALAAKYIQRYAR